MSFINIGFGNIVNTDKIVAIVTSDSAPSKRMVQNAKENGSVVDATQGRRTRGVIVTDAGQIILSALTPEAITRKIKNIIQLEKEGEDFED